MLERLLEDGVVVAVCQVVGPAAVGEVLAFVGIQLDGAFEVAERAGPVVRAQPRLALLELALGPDRALGFVERLGFLAIAFGSARYFERLTGSVSNSKAWVTSRKALLGEIVHG